MRSFTCLTVLLFMGHLLFAKDLGPEIFYNRYRAAKSDSERIYHLGKLAGYYYAIREDASGDSIVEKQIMLAEETRNKNIILKVLFENPRFSLMGTVVRPKSSVTTDVTGKTLHYINRALSYARFSGREDYVALGYSTLSRHYLREGDFQNAFKFANQGFTTALGTSNDSVKVIGGLQLGSAYLKLKEVVMAFKTFTNAYDIADRIQNPILLSQVYHYYSLLYTQLGKDEEARDYIFRSVEINQNTKNATGLIDDYLAFGMMNSSDQLQKQYCVRAERLADSLEDMQGKLESQRILLLCYLSEGDIQRSLTYLSQHQELKQITERRGPHYLDWLVAEIHQYGNDFTTAETYFSKAAADFDKYYTTDTRHTFFGEFADCYKSLNKSGISIQYYLKAYNLCLQTSSTASIIAYTKNLKELYHSVGDYKQAYLFSSLYNNYRDSLNMISKEKDLALLEIDNVSKQRIKAAELEQIAADRRHNLQYMGITATIASAFVLLLFLGLFTVSTVIVRILGFFSFILFFEFIILLIDHKIHEMMHGEPLKIWLVKIVLLSGLLPFHHWLEEKCVHYFLKRKPLSIKNYFSLKRVFLRLKEPAEISEKNKGGAFAPPTNNKV